MFLLARPLFTYCHPRGAYILRLVGSRVGPAVRVDRRRRQVPLVIADRRRRATPIF